MTNEQFATWLKDLKQAWVAKNPQAAADLCADKLIWYDIPFGKPLTTKHEVYTEWQTVPKNQKDIRVSYEILAVNKDFGIAHWNAKFTRIPSNTKAHLDGIFKVTLNEDNLCTEFHQWFNSFKE